MELSWRLGDVRMLRGCTSWAAQSRDAGMSADPSVMGGGSHRNFEIIIFTGCPPSLKANTLKHRSKRANLE